MTEPAFRTRDLTKVYVSGAVEVLALQLLAFDEDGMIGEAVGRR